MGRVAEADPAVQRARQGVDEEVDRFRRLQGAGRR
jgi:hypothetical protein